MAPSLRAALPANQIPRVDFVTFVRYSFRDGRAQGLVIGIFG
jgi:hypothetical protein